MQFFYSHLIHLNPPALSFWTRFHTEWWFPACLPRRESEFETYVLVDQDELNG